VALCFKKQDRDLQEHYLAVAIIGSMKVGVLSALKVSVAAAASLWIKRRIKTRGKAVAVGSP
jgi:hypothetical protein